MSYILIHSLPAPWLAQWLGVSESTIRRWAREEEWPVRRHVFPDGSKRLTYPVPFAYARRDRGHSVSRAGDNPWNPFAAPRTAASSKVTGQYRFAGVNQGAKKRWWRR